MTSQKPSDKKIEPKVKTEYPDPAAAANKPEDGQDRPGFDLGGSSKEGRTGPTNTIPGGPRSSPVGGAASNTSGAAGSEGSGAPDGSGGPRI